MARNLPPNFHSNEYGGIAPPHWMVFLPAYTVLPFVRSPLGYDMVRLTPAIKRTLGLIIFPPLVEAIWVAFTNRQLPANIGHTYLTAFALAYLILSLAIFVRRWLGQRRGDELHSGEAGYSWLAWYSNLPVPPCEIIVVPAVVTGVGYLLINGPSRELGWWLEAAGTSLFLMALWEYRRTWSQRRATVDDVVRAKVFEERVDHATSGQSQSGPRQERRREPEPEFADLHEEDSHESRQQEAQRGEPPGWDGKMNRADALEVLELKEGATRQEINAAYSRLMQKVHPDLGGSTFFAKQLNAARKTLLG
jgi:hypothetical protein